jgi:nucleotide-binding universal stress UspA family protein
MPIETVLVAVGPDDEDHAERLAGAAADVAVPAGATIVIGHVFTAEEYSDAIQRLGFDKTADQLSPGDVARRLPPVSAVANAMDELDVGYEIRGLIDDEDGAVVRLAEDVDADRVLVGGRRRSPAGKAVFGSRAQEVMLNAPCPVTYVRAGME